MASPTHHRAVALVLTVVVAIGLARTVSPRTTSPALDPGAHHARADAGALDAALEPTPLDPNTADLDALVRLPGIGPALARRILAARDAGPPFARLEDLRRVRGVGPRTLARLAPLLVFPTAAPPDAAIDRRSSAALPGR